MLIRSDSVSVGVAFHHAGMDVADRTTVEQRYLKGDLGVICCTTTLAVGINLPCHLVIIKGTSTYQDGGARELSELEVLQMLGRAGRPQFDTSAVAVVMTRQENAARWDKLVSGEEILESWYARIGGLFHIEHLTDKRHSFHLNLIEHLVCPHDSIYDYLANIFRMLSLYSAPFITFRPLFSG